MSALKSVRASSYSGWQGIDQLAVKFGRQAEVDFRRVHGRSFRRVRTSLTTAPWPRVGELPYLEPGLAAGCLTA